MATMDALIDASSIRELGRVLHQCGVDAPGVAAAVDTIAGRGLRERVDIVRDAVLADMPHGYDALAAVVRAAFTDVAFSGWMLTRTQKWEQVLLIVAAILLVVPELISSLIGLALIIPVLLRQVSASRAPAAAA